MKTTTITTTVKTVTEDSDTNIRFEFKVGDKVRVRTMGEQPGFVKGEVIARYYISASFTNGYLIRLQEGHFHPIYKSVTYAMPAIESFMTIDMG